MQIISFRITPIIATVCFSLAITGIVSTSAYGDQTFGTPHGTLTVTTPDPTLVPWPAWTGETKPHHQMRADQTYDATSLEYYQDGKFDPKGEIGIRRFFQTRTPNTYNLGGMSEIMEGKLMPANSRFNQAQCNWDFGFFTPDLSNYANKKQSNGDVISANDVYGVETIELVFYDKASNIQTVLDYQKIDIYGTVLKQAASFSVQNFRQKTALNTNTTGTPTSYGGDPPRAIMSTTQSIYPGAETWVVIYPGSAQLTPPSAAKKIDSTDAIAPSTPVWDAWQRDNVYIDTGNFVSGPGIYTLQLMQKSTANGTPAQTETFGDPASFNINNSYMVNSQLGLTK